MPAHVRRRDSSSQLSRALERERLTFEAIERVICRKSSGEITGLAQLGVWGGVNCPMERRVRFPGCLASAMLDQRRGVSEGDSRRDHRAHGRRARQLLGGARHDPSASAREEPAGLMSEFIKSGESGPGFNAQSEMHDQHMRSTGTEAARRARGFHRWRLRTSRPVSRAISAQAAPALRRRTA